MVATCPSDNTIDVDQSSFWSNGSLHWDAHRVGWAIAGGCAAATTLLTLILTIMHARNYRVPAEQRQILRIIYLPMVYAVISFLSYRFFREYTYYSLVDIAYEALAIGAFLLLLIDIVSRTAADAKVESAIARKDKQKMPFPFCCWRYRPTKPYFMYTLKWSVLQYCIVRPAVSIAGIICQAFNVLCTSQWSVHFANVYLEAVDFVSISVALYGLILFYVLTHRELEGRRPLAKFLAIKLIVFFTFYQGFVFDVLQKKGVIKATQYWSEANIVDGLSALATTIEMVIFALFCFYAYPASEYYDENLGRKRSAWKAIWDSINYSDFVLEIYLSLKFFVRYMIGRPETRSEKDRDEKGRPNFDQAFNIDRTGYHTRSAPSDESDQRGFFRGQSASMDRGASTIAQDDYITSPNITRPTGDRIPMAYMPSQRR